MNSRVSRRIGRVGVFGWLAVILLTVLFPIYWMVVTALKPAGEMYVAQAILWVPHPTLKNFSDLLSQTSFLQQMRNSAIVALTSTVVGVLLSTLAAYSLTRVHYRGRNVISAGIFFSYLLPPTLLFIPMYVVFDQLRLLNQLPALMVAYLSITVPFCTWMLKGYFLSIPVDLEEAALVDGCSRLQALRRILMPLAAPGVAASSIFAFTLAWNEYLYALVFLSGVSKTTLPVGLSSLIYGDVFLWGQIMAGAVIMSFPILAVYIVGQRYVISGMTAGAIKG